MYRQIRINDEDTDFQRILWRPNTDQPIQHYKVLRLTFVTACAPYLAMTSIQRLAIDEQSKYPLAAKITLYDYYVDDLLNGCESIDEAKEIYDQMVKLMGVGGFILQKWNTNSQALLEYIEEESKGSEVLVFKTNNDMIKVLGIRWNRTTDCFEYVLKLSDLSDIINRIRRYFAEIHYIKDFRKIYFSNIRVIK
ncbi:unnamed protein product [Parnassius mnemosyne]|uniref:Reverse transcriptase domain-containing protein n=1 Tax=Parnassius mnemosyne TaxID=213953 RepID=A0AAV1KIY1_9NEOP